MAGPLNSLTKPGGANSRKRLIVLAGLGALLFLWMRSNQGGPAATGIVGSYDPVAASDGLLGGGGGTAPVGADAATAAALEGIGFGLEDIATRLANNEANQQTLSDQLATNQAALDALSYMPGYDPYAYDYVDTGYDPYATGGDYYDGNAYIDAANARAAEWASGQKRSTSSVSVLPRATSLDGGRGSLPSIRRGTTPPPVKFTPQTVRTIFRQAPPAQRPLPSPVQVRQTLSSVPTGPVSRPGGAAAALNRMSASMAGRF